MVQNSGKDDEIAGNSKLRVSQSTMHYNNCEEDIFP